MKMGESEEGVVVDATVDAGRRSAMRKIAVGVGVLASYSVLPESWTKPIIGQIALPAHAGTSGSSLHDPCEVELRGGDHTTEEIILKITGFVTPPVANLSVTITSTAVGGANQKVETKTITNSEGTFEAFVTIGGGPGITSVNVTTVVSGAYGAANCVVHTSAASNPTGTTRTFRDVIEFGEGEQSTICMNISGTTATFFAFDPDQVTNPGKYIGGTGPISSTLTGVDGDTTVEINIIGGVDGDAIHITIRVYETGSDPINIFVDDDLFLPITTESCVG